MAHHGMAQMTGWHYACRHATPDKGRFRRIFPDLPPLYHDPRVYQKAGAVGGAMDIGSGPNLGTSSTIPLGYCFLGQFIDHDITLDISSSFDRVNDPEGIENVRTPVLDLDCVYGQGPEASRHQYWRTTSANPSFGSSINSETTFLTGPSDRDLPRSPTANGEAALIGDFRNDENRVVSQLQLLFLLFHNRVVKELLNDLGGGYAPRHGYHDYIRAMHDAGDVGGARHELFGTAQQLTRWHYQWIVVQDFLRRVCGPDIVDDILCNGRKVFTCTSHPFIPIEFAVAAYRYGHTQVPKELKYNSSVDSELFEGPLGNGFERVPGGLGPIDWGRFFGANAQMAGAIDTQLSRVLLELPFVAPGAERSLATRNMLRSQSFRLPSGQQVADRIAALCGTTPVYPPMPATGMPAEMHDHTPLWIYILSEGLLSGGQHLGPVGGRIVAEVLIGLLECDPTSYMGANRNWVPVFMRDPSHTWDMEAMVNFTLNGDYA